MMIRYFVIAVLIGTMLSVSCDKDSSSPNPLVEGIIGSWEAYTGSITGCTEFDDNRPGINYGDCSTASVCTQYVFNADLTMQINYKTTSSSYRELTGTYSLSGNQLIICVTHFSDCITYSATIDNEILKLIHTSVATGCINTTSYKKF